MIYAGTGHRPPKLGGYGPTTNDMRTEFAVKTLKSLDEVEEVLTGMALGWDMALAEACLVLDIPYTACVPFKGQEDRWPRTARARYAELLKLAAKREFLYPSYNTRAFQGRNEFMVNNCDYVLALWNGDEAGGTYNCVKYAQEQRVEVINVWDEWRLFNGEEP